jgi:hypothetical protein
MLVSNMFEWIIAYILKVTLAEWSNSPVYMIWLLIVNWCNASSNVNETELVKLDSDCNLVVSKISCICLFK